LLELSLLAGALLAVLVGHGRTVRLERERWEAERRSLLDRIQFPEARQVERGEPVEHELPKDPAEMAFVGQEVPEFINVGSEE
jgi:hypothetical protein